MTLLEQLVNSTGESVIIGKDINNKFVVCLNKWAISTDTGGALGECGRGDTIEQATEDYINKISGKSLVYRYGSDDERFAKFICFVRNQLIVDSGSYKDKKK